MNCIVHVSASFNLEGAVRPDYVWLENKEHILKCYKILNKPKQKEENYAGIQTLVFDCEIIDENRLIQIRLKHYGSSHKWMLVQ